MRQNLRPVQLAAERADASQLGTSVGTARGLRRIVLGRSESLAAAPHATVTHPWSRTAIHLRAIAKRPRIRPRLRPAGGFGSCVSSNRIIPEQRREVGRNRGITLFFESIPSPHTVHPGVRRDSQQSPRRVRKTENAGCVGHSRGAGGRTISCTHPTRITPAAYWVSAR